MHRSKIVHIQDLSIGDTIVLNDTEAFDNHGAFYVSFELLNDSYHADQNTLRIGQVLEIDRSKNVVKFLSVDKRVVDADSYSTPNFSVYTPTKKIVADVSAGDEILMRGNYSPTRWSKKCEYGVIAARFGYSSTVLKIRRKWNGDYKLTIIFAGMKKFRFVVESDAEFELSPDFE